MVSLKLRWHYERRKQKSENYFGSIPRRKEEMVITMNDSIKKKKQRLLQTTGKAKAMRKGKANRFGCPSCVMFTVWKIPNST